MDSQTKQEALSQSPKSKLELQQDQIAANKARALQILQSIQSNLDKNVAYISKTTTRIQGN